MILVMYFVSNSDTFKQIDLMTSLEASSEVPGGDSRRPLVPFEGRTCNHTERRCFLHFPFWNLQKWRSFHYGVLKGGGCKGGGGKFE